MEMHSLLSPSRNRFARALLRCFPRWSGWLPFEDGDEIFVVGARALAYRHQARVALVAIDFEGDELLYVVPTRWTWESSFNTESVSDDMRKIILARLHRYQLEKKVNGRIVERDVIIEHVIT
jgi:hypothetical protein